MTWKNWGQGWLGIYYNSQAGYKYKSEPNRRHPNTPYYQVLSFKITIGLNHPIQRRAANTAAVEVASTVLLLASL